MDLKIDLQDTTGYLFKKDYNDKIATLFSYLENRENINLLRKNQLTPQLSLPHIKYARNEIIKFFDEKLDFICYGNTSAGYCSHCLLRKENKIYLVFLNLKGDISAYLLPRFYLINLFEDEGYKSALENNMPDYNSEMGIEY